MKFNKFTSLLLALSFLIYSFNCRASNEIIEDEKLKISFSKVSSHKLDIKNEREEFYIFSVGQGNSQLAVYEQYRFAVLYDCGSASTQIHPKIDKLQNSEDFSFVFKRKENIFKIPSNLPNVDFKEEEIVEDSTFEMPVFSQSSNISNVESKERGKYTKDFIKEIISSYDIQHLFIFLSHPDKDHINYIDENTLPDALRVTAFLCGDWLGDGGANTNKDDLTTDVKKVLDFLTRRKNTWLELPYYWNYKDNDLDYNSVKDSLYLNEKDNTKELFNIFKSKAFPNNIPEVFYGNLKELVEVTPNYKSKSYLKDSLKDHIKRVDFESLSLINILSMNHHFKDINSQSAVLCFIMPKIKMNIVCSGDANKETFSLIKNLSNKPQSVKYLLQDINETEKNIIDGKNDVSSQLKNIQKKAIENTTLNNLNIISYLSPSLDNFNKEDYLNIVMIPHHGSEDNWSPEIFDLFKPDVLCVSAGNGKMYQGGGHPQQSIILAYEKMAKNYNRDKFINNFKEGDIKCSTMLFDDKREAHMYDYKKENIPILCNNILGTIKIEDLGFKSTFSNIINALEEDENSTKYLVHFKERVLIDFDETDEIGNFFRVSKTSDQVYYCVKSGSKTLLYRAEKI